MELWIRSQDREKLVKCNDIALTTDSEDMKTISGYKIVGYFDKNTEYEELGFYTNKKRALEVLDEIKNKINNNYKNYLMSCMGEKGTYEIIAWEDFVYEMPKD